MNSKTRRVLIYRLGSLGDTVVALPALHLVARAFPNAERRMLTNAPVSSKAASSATVLDGSGLIHGYFLYAVGVRSLRGLVSLWWQLVRWRPQVVVYMAPFRGTASVLRDSRFFALCGVARQIGVPLTEGMQQNAWRESQQVVESESSRLARNLAELGEAELDDPANWELRLSEVEIAVARAALEPAAGRPVIAVSLGTKLEANDWGKENWRNLLAELAARYPEYALALCGALEEAEVSEFAAQGWLGAALNGVAVNLCGKLTPRESAAVFAESRLFIGHDSGPVHLAAAMQTPCVAIFGARNEPGKWFPHGSRHRVIYHRVECRGCGLEICIEQKKRCITSITVAEVVAEIDAVLVRMDGTLVASDHSRSPAAQW